MSTAPTLEDLYKEVAPELARVESEIQEALADDEPLIAALTAQASGYGGKRLRPALVLIVARALGGLESRHARLGAVVELVHLATLVHDDVIDGAELRRARRTVNASFGNYEAVLLGDVIFARAIHLLGRLEDQRSLLDLTRAVSTLCVGEILQNRHRRNLDLPLDVYYRIIDAKTAELYAAGAGLSAHLAGGGKDIVDGLARFGRELGVAFQIIDDCLDLTGDEAVVGKSLGTDLDNGKMTLPLLLLRDSGSAGRAAVAAVIGSERPPPEATAALRQGLEAGGFVPAALERARAHVGSGLAAAKAVLPRTAHPTLEAVGDFVLRRRV